MGEKVVIPVVIHLHPWTIDFYFQNAQSEIDNLNETLVNKVNYVDTRHIFGCERTTIVVLEYLKICEVNFELYLLFSFSFVTFLNIPKNEDKKMGPILRLGRALPD